MISVLFTSLRFEITSNLTRNNEAGHLSQKCSIPKGVWQLQNKGV
jgi:hypothetical protein